MDCRDPKLPIPEVSPISPREWAPKDLVDLYERRDDLGIEYFRESIRFESIQMLQRFITDERMNVVWKTMRSANTRAGKFSDCGISLFYVCQSAIAEWKAYPKETLLQRRISLKEIHDKAINLIKLINESGYFPEFNLEELFTDEEIEGLAVTFGALNELDLVVTEANDEKNIESKLLQFRVLSWKDLPPVTSVIERFAETVRRRATSDAVGSLQPHTDTASVHYLARSISSYFRREYNENWDRLVADIVNLVYEPAVDLEPGNVEKLRVRLSL